MIHIFNPENDMALANNTVHYKAPKEIVRMGEDLSVFPAWFARTGDYVKVESAEKIGCFEQMCDVYGIGVHAQLTSRYVSAEVRPWGWSRVLIKRLEEQGVEPLSFLSEQAVNEVRRLSGRQMTIDILRQFDGEPMYCGISKVCVTLDEVKQFVLQHRKVMLKAPWSGSGRGLVSVDSVDMGENIAGWISRIIRTQGAIMAEKRCNKVADFAVEFYSDGKGGITYVGLSMFETDDDGFYKGNHLVSDQWITAVIEQYVEPNVLPHTIEKLCGILSHLVGPYYKGYMGVDMMICIEDNGYCIHPCVELNLRMNMGVATRLIYDEYVCAGSIGNFVVEHFFKNGEAMEFQQLLTREHPCRVVDNRLAEGYLPLTPVNDATRFHIYLIV